MQNLFGAACDIWRLGMDRGTGAESVPAGIGGGVKDDGEDEGGGGGDAS